jgi:hypothetical protein
MTINIGRRPLDQAAICFRVYRSWSRCPQLRLGQFLYNALGDLVEGQAEGQAGRVATRLWTWSGEDIAERCELFSREYGR